MQLKNLKTIMLKTFFKTSFSSPKNEPLVNKMSAISLVLVKFMFRFSMRASPTWSSCKKSNVLKIIYHKHLRFLQYACAKYLPKICINYKV